MMRFIATTLLLAGAASAKVILDFGSEWKWEASGTDLGSAWTGLNYNDGGWNSGPAQLGFGDGDEATQVSGSTTQIYFRHTLTLSPAEGFVSVVAKVVRDDGVICYLNGVEIGRDNMPEGSAYGTPAIVALSGDQESTPVTMNVGDGNLITGSNIIACSVHNQSPGSSDISFDFALEGTVAPSPSAPPLTTFDETVVGKTTGPWKFEDSGTSLTGTAWTTLGYDDATWGSANGVLGYGDGQPGAIAQNGVTAYFRRVFTVDNIARVEFGKISILRDDGAVCYVNGAEILRDNMPAGAITHDTLAPAGVGNADETRYSADAKFDRSVMQTGNNLLACEVHQQSAGSSDLSFDAVLKLGLTINFNEPSPSGSNTPQPSPTRSPAASPVTAASASPAASPSPAGSGGGGGSDPSSSPAASPSPAGSGGGGVSATPTPSRSPVVDGGICECSCACLGSCAAGDPLLTQCGGNNGDSGSSSSVGVAIGVVAAVLVIGGLAVGGFMYKKKQDEKNAGAGAKAPAADKANPMLLTNGPADVEAGGKSSRSHRDRKHGERSSKDKERSSRSRRSEKDGEKDGEKDEKRRSRSSRHKDGEKDGEKDEKRRSRSSRHKDGEKDEKRKSRSDKDKDGEKRHRSSSRRHKDGEERSERKSRSSSKRPEGEKERSSRRSRSPRKSRE